MLTLGHETLCLRNVPDDVSERLARLAAREGLSVSSFAVRELEAVASRADNDALLRSLASFDVTAAAVTDELDVSRAGR